MRKGPEAAWRHRTVKLHYSPESLLNVTVLQRRKGLRFAGNKINSHRARLDGGSPLAFEGVVDGGMDRSILPRFKVPTDERLPSIDQVEPVGEVQQLLQR